MGSVTQIVPALLTDLRDCAAAAYESPDPSIPLPKPTAVIRQEGFTPTIDKADLLLISPSTITTAFQGPAEQCATVLRFSMTLTIIRDIPNLDAQGNIAPDDEMVAAALGLAADMSLLWYSVTSACRAGTLWRSFAELDCRDTHFGDGRPGAQGGLGFWQLPVTVSVTAGLLS